MLDVIALDVIRLALLVHTIMHTQYDKGLPKLCSNINMQDDSIDSHSSHLALSSIHYTNKACCSYTNAFVPSIVHP